MTKVFYSVFDESMKTLGFKRSGKIYHKMLGNQVVGMLSYRTYSSGHELTIQFDVIPFCKGCVIKRFMDGSYFLSDVAAGFEPLLIDRIELSDAFNELLGKCKDSVFPLFDMVKDYKSYLEFYNKVRRYEEDLSNNDYPYPYSYSLVIPITNVLLALGKYDLALLAYEAKVKISENAVESQSKSLNVAPEHTPAYPSYYERLDLYNHMKELVEENDTLAIEMIIKDSEQISRESYYKYFGK